MSAVDFLTTPARQNATLGETAHRPWPLRPPGGWLMAQTWLDLLFVHWRVPVEAIRAHVPPELPVDTFDGDAWLGVTPFRITGFRLKAMPPVPGLSSFPECNARTYVTVDGKSGIWFFSLDAGSRLAVEGARRAYRLPYFHARMSVAEANGRIVYASERRGDRPAVFRASYRPTGPVFNAEPGTLDYFLTERYCLYTVDRGTVFRAEIHHPPWPLHPADAAVGENTLPPPGIGTPGEPVVHFAPRQDVLLWPLQRLG